MVRRVYKQHTKRKVWLLLLLGVMALAPRFASAFNWVPSEKQFYLLPIYCKAKMSQFLRASPHLRHDLPLLPEGQVREWERMVGPDYLHLHHYCHGTALMSLAETPAAHRRIEQPRSRRQRYSTKREDLYKRAISEIRYTRSQSRPGRPLWEAMTLDYAKALGGAGDRKKATSVYKELAESYPENPDVWIGYARLMKRSGELNAAITILETGLGSSRKKGPLLFWLAQYQYHLGDFTAAAETAERAEKAGMKMDRLKRKMGSAAGVAD